MDLPSPATPPAELTAVPEEPPPTIGTFQRLCHKSDNFPVGEF
jgi:hypothetical protein